MCILLFKSTTKNKLRSPFVVASRRLSKNSELILNKPCNQFFINKQYHHQYMNYCSYISYEISYKHPNLHDISETSILINWLTYLADTLQRPSHLLPSWSINLHVWGNMPQHDELDGVSSLLDEAGSWLHLWMGTLSDPEMNLLCFVKYRHAMKIAYLQTQVHSTCF